VTVYVALLRGVNVGGRNRLPMADLRRIAEGCGHRDVRTYIQSGNLVFVSDVPDAGEVAARLRAAILAGAGVDSRVAIRSRVQLERVVAEDPFPGADPARRHVTFLFDPPPPGALDGLDGGAYAPERAAIAAGELHMHLPAGLGRSRLAADLARRPDLAGTTRNWRTVSTLLAMAAGEA
jgi:uncharacterized protein (DUF1697 family)